MRSHHTFDINLAKELKSIELAILVHHFKYWTEYNERMKKNFYEGRYWMYQTIEELANHFPYWSKDQVKRYIVKLVEKKILIKGNFNKTAFDRTTWYAFNTKSEICAQEALGAKVQNRQMEDAKSPNGRCEIAPPIPHSKKDTKTYKDNVCTMPCSKEKVDKGKVKSYKSSFLNKLTKEQKEMHDKIVAHKPDWGEPPKSEEVCAWFLAKKYTITQVGRAFEVYQQDAVEARAKGKTIDSMGGYIVAAIKNQRILKNRDFEANKHMAQAACKENPEIRALEKYLSYHRGSDEVQIMYNLPVETFTDQLEAAKNWIQFNH